jgi:hypothetical protein
MTAGPGSQRERSSRSFLNACCGSHGPDDDWDATTVVEFAVAVLDDGLTEVRVTHLGWEQFGDRAHALRTAHEAGWRYHLDQLRRFCQTRSRDVASARLGCLTTVMVSWHPRSVVVRARGVPSDRGGR